jgi:hypothetical protein
MGRLGTTAPPDGSTVMPNLDTDGDPARVKVV